MNNNRGNNRRRGRGSNRQQGNQQLNRIDSRARGNATQMLDKYKKLAHDAHLNGDRVQEEYFLQFADHYFRVVADQKQRQEESRQRREERSPSGNPDSDRREDARDSSDGREREAPDVRESAGAPSTPSAKGNVGDDSEGGRDGTDANFEPTENPFVRESQPPRSSKPRKPRRAPRDDEDRDEGAGREGEVSEASVVDPSVLPPSIGGDAGEEDEKPKPRRRTRKPKPAGDPDETLEAVN